MYYKSIVKPILDHTKQFVSEHDINLVPFFVTNASLLNSDMIKELSIFSPLYQITLDGNQAKHDQVRVWKGGSNRGTYRQIINAIKMISQYSNYSYPKISSIATIRINYDDDTLDNIMDILKDLEGVDYTKFHFHLERVWQTIKDRSHDQTYKLINAVKLIRNSGFSVGFGLFGNKRVSCPAEVDNYAIINWDGNIYKCNGRTLLKENSVGVLRDDGVINWDENKQAVRLAKATFENKMCIACKMLPRCMGPCSQKQIELSNKHLKKACPLQLLEMGLKDYIYVNFELLLLNTLVEID